MGGECEGLSAVQLSGDTCFYIFLAYVAASCLAIALQENWREVRLRGHRWRYRHFMRSARRLRL